MAPGKKRIPRQVKFSIEISNMVLVLANLYKQKSTRPPVKIISTTRLQYSVRQKSLPRGERAKKTHGHLYLFALGRVGRVNLDLEVEVEVTSAALLSGSK